MFVCAAMSAGFAERVKIGPQFLLPLENRCRKTALQREVWNIDCIESWPGTEGICLGSV